VTKTATDTILEAFFLFSKGEESILEVVISPAINHSGRGRTNTRAMILVCMQKKLDRLFLRFVNLTPGGGGGGSMMLPPGLSPSSLVPGQTTSSWPGCRCDRWSPGIDIFCYCWTTNFIFVSILRTAP
jgi:hypothetical protein